MLEGFTDEKIVSLLGASSLWAKRACREILKRKDDFVPLLLDILEKTERNELPLNKEYADTYIPAALLLAQMREEAAYPLLVRLIAVDDDEVDLIWGDILTDCYVSMLRDTFNGDSSLIPALAEDRGVSCWSRAMAIMAWGTHFLDGRVSREETVRVLRRLVREVYIGKPDHDDKNVLSYIAECVFQQKLSEMLGDIKDAYDRGGVDTFFCGTWEKYEADFGTKGKREDEHIDDAIAVLQKWRWFEPVTEDDEKDDGEDGFSDDEPGRNDPCPCGSGKKYKRCCGRN